MDVGLRCSKRSVLSPFTLNAIFFFQVVSSLQDTLMEGNSILLSLREYLELLLQVILIDSHNIRGVHFLRFLRGMTQTSAYFKRERDARQTVYEDPSHRGPSPLVTLLCVPILFLPTSRLPTQWSAASSHSKFSLMFA